MEKLFARSVVRSGRDVATTRSAWRSRFEVAAASSAARVAAMSSFRPSSAGTTETEPSFETTKRAFRGTRLTRRARRAK
jgi:hypothetical protein